MTPYEEMQQRQMAAAIAQATNTPISQRAASAAGMMPGMISQSAGTPDINAARQRASASTKGAESKLAQQQAYANSLRGGKMPDGREVGPSGIYVQANAGEMAKYAADQLAGGYLAGQAGKAADELDVAQTDVKLGGLELEDARTDAANQFSTDERAAGQDFDAKQQGLRLAADAANNQARLTSAEGIAANNLTQDWANMKDVPYYNTKTGDVTSTWMTPNGRVMRQGDTTVPVDPAMWKPQGDLVATKAGDQPQPGADFSSSGVGGKTAPPDTVGRILNSDYIDEATGALDARRWLGTLGYGTEGNQVQDLQRDMGTVLIQGMAANLETMEAKPVSDFESRMAQLPVPDANTQPYGWVGWSANTYRPAAENEMNMAIAETRAAGQEDKAMAQEAKRDEILLKHDKDTVRAAIKHDYPMKSLVQAGVDPELIEYMLDLKEQGKL